jgi:hypothetical protein
MYTVRVLCIRAGCDAPAETVRSVIADSKAAEAVTISEITKVTDMQVAADTVPAAESAESEIADSNCCK